jgi:hypothetical protein
MGLYNTQEATASPGAVERISKLKRWGNAIYAAAINSAALSAMAADYVSPTGLTVTDLKEKLHRFRECAESLEIRDYKSVGEKVHNGSWCHNPAFCPVCASRVQSRRRGLLRPAIRRAIREYPYAYIFTITQADQAQLAPMLHDIKDSFRRFRLKGQRRKLPGGGYDYSRGEWSKVRAGIMSWEVKRGEGSGLWHAHAHALVFCDKPLDYGYSTGAGVFSKLKTEWIEATGGAGENINARRLTNPPDLSNIKDDRARAKTAAKFRGLGYVDSVWEQSKEVTKYVAMLDNRGSDDTITVAIDTHGFRMFNKFGAFRGASSTMSEYIEEVPVAGGDEEIPLSIRTAQWDMETGAYAGGRVVTDSLSAKATEQLRTDVLSAAAKVQGKYRANRNTAVAARQAWDGIRCVNGFCGALRVTQAELYSHLEELKRDFRHTVGGIWGAYARATSRAKWPFTYADLKRQYNKYLSESFLAPIVWPQAPPIPI